jgi:hypothetical protein
MTSAVLEELTTTETSAAETAQRDYADIVRRLAAGDDDPTLEEVQSTLRASGKTRSDLLADIAKHRHRVEMRETMAKAADAESERETIDRQIKAADSALKQAQAAHAATITPLKERLSAIFALTTQANMARNDLLRTCGDGPLRLRDSRVRATMKQVAEQKREQRRLIDRIKALISEERLRIDRREGDAETLSAACQRLNAAQHALTELQTRETELLTEQESILELMIES